MPQIGIFAALAAQVYLSRGRFQCEGTKEQFRHLPEAKATSKKGASTKKKAYRSCRIQPPEAGLHLQRVFAIVLPAIVRKGIVLGAFHDVGLCGVAGIDLSRCRRPDRDDRGPQSRQRNGVSDFSRSQDKDCRDRTRIKRGSPSLAGSVHDHNRSQARWGTAQDTV